MLLSLMLVAACADPLTQRDPALQRDLETALKHSELAAPLREGKLTVAVVDLTRPGAALYAGINDDVMLYAASLPKIGILLAVVQQLADGDLTWGPEVSYRLRKMITVSSNAYASWGTDLVGLRNIGALMQSPRYCLYERPEGGLWVGRPYRRSNESHRDPMHDISHGATARQTARFYTLLDHERLVSPYWSRRMLDWMGPPGHRHKFVGGLAHLPAVQFLARKSGTWRHFHSDSALIQHHASRYVLVGLAEHANGERLLRLLAREADHLITRGAHRR